MTTLELGKLIVYPTDTAYAIGCRFDDEQGIQNIMQLKGRTDTKFVLIAASLEMVQEFFPLNECQLQLAKQHWPGPLSIVVSPQFSIRVPDLPEAREVSTQLGAPVIATSFNKSGTGAIYDLDLNKTEEGNADLRSLLENPFISSVINIGPLAEQAPSTVVECTEDQLIIHRDGPIVVEKADLRSLQKYQPPTTVEELKAVLKVLGSSANTDIGQNFLVDELAVQASLDAAQLTSEDTVLEIGPGLGVLTTSLAQQAGQVVAVELDTRLEPVLTAIEGTYPNVQIIRQDILKTNLHEAGLVDREFKVVANIPYQITSLLLRNLLTITPRPTQMVLLVQKEVAQRVVAKPGKHSILSLSVQLYGFPEIVYHVPAESFYPVPRVDSAVINIKNIGNGPAKQLTEQQEQLFFALIKAGFAHKRKKLLNNLEAGQFLGQKIPKSQWKEWFNQLELLETARAQELSLTTWIKMVDNVSLFVI